MKKIIITESQFKKLLKITEEVGDLGCNAPNPVPDRLSSQVVASPLKIAGPNGGEEEELVDILDTDMVQGDMSRNGLGLNGTRGRGI